MTRINPTTGLKYLRVETEENRIDVADRMKRMAVRGFIGAEPITKIFKVILSICHPNKTKNGRIKTIHPNTREQFFRNSNLVSTQNLLQSINCDQEIQPTSPRA